MSHQGKRLKHFVIIRFFPYKRPEFNQDIFDLDFVARQVSLAKNNCLKSLENQSNKNFEIVFLANENYFADKKFDFIFTDLTDATSLPMKFIKCNSTNLATSELLALINDARDEYDFVIQSRIDFDDFIYKDAVTDTQNKIEDCDSILAYGYLRGYTYFNGELYPYYEPWRGVGHKSIFQSIILETSFAKKIPFMGIYSFNHTKVKLKLEEVFASKGLPFYENMFQQNSSTNAFIWFRHDETWSNDGNAYVEIPKYVKRVKKLTADDISKKQLEEEFGFYYDVNSIQ